MAISNTAWRPRCARPSIRPRRKKALATALIDDVICRSPTPTSPPLLSRSRDEPSMLAMMSFNAERTVSRVITGTRVSRPCTSSSARARALETACTQGTFCRSSAWTLPVASRASENHWPIASASRRRSASASNCGDCANWCARPGLGSRDRRSARRSAMSAQAASSKPARSNDCGTGVSRQCRSTAARSNASGTRPGPGERRCGAASINWSCKAAAASRSAVSRASRWRATAGPRSTFCVPWRRARKGDLPKIGLRSRRPRSGVARSIQRPVFMRRPLMAEKSVPGPVSNRSLRTAVSAHWWGRAAATSPTIRAAAQATALPVSVSRAGSLARMAAGSPRSARPGGIAVAALSSSAKSRLCAASTGRATTAWSTSRPMGVSARAAATCHIARRAAKVASLGRPASERRGEPGSDRSGPPSSEAEGV